MSSEFTWDWERAAMRGDDMPERLPLPDQMAYTAMRNLYVAYHRNIIDRGSASAEKRRIMRSYKLAVDQIAFDDKLARHRAQILRDTEAAKTACRKEPTAENAARLCDTLDGLCR